MNQYTSVAGTPVTYNANGELASDHRGRSYTYAADGRLREVHEANGDRIGNYAYYAARARRRAD